MSDLARLQTTPKQQRWQEFYGSRRQCELPHNRYHHERGFARSLAGLRQPVTTRHVTIQRMTRSAHAVLEQALELAPNDRAKVAAELLASLDETDEETYAEWVAEIERRAADAEANPDAEQDWRDVLTEIRRDVLSR